MAGMPHTVEVGDLWESMGTRYSGATVAERQQFLDHLYTSPLVVPNAGTGAGAASGAIRNSALNDPSATAAQELAGRVTHVNLHWNGLDSAPAADDAGDPHATHFVPRQPAPTGTDLATTGWWRAWYGDAHGILRETLIRALEISLGYDHDPRGYAAAAGGEEPLQPWPPATRRWAVQFLWFCPSPKFEGWVNWRAVEREARPEPGRPGCLGGAVERLLPLVDRVAGGRFGPVAERMAGIIGRLGGGDADGDRSGDDGGPSRAGMVTVCFATPGTESCLSLTLLARDFDGLPTRLVHDEVPYCDPGPLGTAHDVTTDWTSYADTDAAGPLSPPGTACHHGGLPGSSQRGLVVVGHAHTRVADPSYGRGRQLPPRAELWRQDLESWAFGSLPPGAILDGSNSPVVCIAPGQSTDGGLGPAGVPFVPEVSR